MDKDGPDTGIFRLVRYRWLFIFHARLRDLPFPGVPKSRKVRLLVNPIGGKGNAMNLVTSLALPVYKAAGCEVDLIGKGVAAPVTSSEADTQYTVAQRLNMQSMQKLSQGI